MCAKSLWSCPTTCDPMGIGTRPLCRGHRASQVHVQLVHTHCLLMEPELPLVLWLRYWCGRHISQAWLNAACTVCAKSLQLCPSLCDSMDYRPLGFSVHGNSPDKNTGVGCHALLQGIFPTQGSNPSLLCLLGWQVGSLPLAPPGKPLNTEAPTYFTARWERQDSRFHPAE